MGHIFQIFGVVLALRKCSKKFKKLASLIVSHFASTRTLQILAIVLHFASTRTLQFL